MVTEICTGRAELQQQHPEGGWVQVIRIGHPAVGGDKSLQAMPGPAGDELGYSAGAGLPAAVERHPALVIMVVAVKHDRDIVLRQQGPNA